LKRNSLAFGIIFLLLVSVLTPIVIGYNINISSEETSQSTTSSSGGLMNSSWPMFGQNVRHTGLSSFGKSGTWYVEKWTYDFEDTLMFSSPAIDKNGTIYLGTHDYHLYAINSDGTQSRWYKKMESWNRKQLGELSACN
jgi:outer membrane protein assembly factor BamB